MVGRSTPKTDNGSLVRRLLPIVSLFLALVACSSAGSVATTRYYDPDGLFTAQLPADTDLQVMPRQKVEGGPSLLSGVLATPAQPSPQPSNQPFAGGGIQPVTTQQDSAIYAVFAVKAGGSTSLTQLANSLLTGTLSPDLVSQQRISAGGLQGLLAVVDHRDDTDPSRIVYTDASGFFLDGTVGYWVRELFPPGQWGDRRDAFLRILRSFRPTVPAGLPAVPLVRPGL